MPKEGSLIHMRGAQKKELKGREKLMMSRKGPLSEASPAKRLVNKESEAQVTGSPGLGAGTAGKGEGGGADSAHCAPGALSFSPF